MSHSSLIFHPADQRGTTTISRLQSAHSFSFGEYYDPENMGFGTMRVINDDIIAGGKGFPSHPHRDMEIITIPLEGGLQHGDSMGNTTIIGPDMIQVMSAGSGLYHAEYNASAEKAVKILQIWIEPKEYGITPRHEEKAITLMPNTLNTLVSPDGKEGSIMIHQDALILRGIYDHQHTVEYSLQDPTHGIYVFVISGSIRIDEQEAQARDAISLIGTDTVRIDVDQGSDILLFEVPME